MLISCDASQLEWRTILELSRDEVGIQEVLDGADTHSLNQEYFNLPSRLIAKIYLFRTIFNRGNGYAFTKDPNFMHVSTSVKFWDNIGQKFYTKYKRIDELYDKNLSLIASGKPIIGPLGREWLIDFVTDWKGDLQLPVTKSVNYPVQGTGADIMMLARLSFKRRLLNSPYADKTLLISTVHDSIVLDAPGAYLEPLNAMFHSVFADIPKNVLKIFGYEWIVPLACEVKYGPNMKDMTKYQ